MSLNNKNLLRNKAYINGNWREASSGNTYDVKNPVDDSVITSVPDMGMEDVKKAIDIADQKFEEWSSMLAKDRSAILNKWYRLLMENQEDLAILMTKEMGKPLKESRGEIAYGASFIQWFAEEAKRIYGDVIPHHADGKRIVVIKQPVGVAGIITPWNFPLAMITRKVGPALAAGCPVVIKPAQDTPLSALAAAYLAEEAGVPAGVLNIITSSSSSEIGKELTTSDKIKKISFTGSTKVGKLLMKQSASTVKKISLELGGNAPFVVFEDADLDEAAQGAVDCKFRNAGQTCVCANRILVHEDVYDDFVEKFAAKVKKLKVGNGLETGIDIGPLINDDAVKKVIDLVQDAIDKGAKIVAGSNEPDGRFIDPIVLTNVDDSVEMFNKEIFGPVAPVYKFSNDDEAIKLSNKTQFGLASYFYSRDIGRIWKVAEQLQYGMVGINEGLISTEVAPFGGVKESGMGREGSKYGIEEYINVKYMLMGGL
ncbi:NAD-dependent succinate-semialdehyde dehydrogenase [Mangrovivirga cuniculi]|uniref:Succinate-semialdehyde dehydrogenase (NADP(+)) n=1 Tax=Mangrovivirga cuniculi TaxID=2715131 RepID=A0A4D7JQR7_9BACT|nr:NAD-dependent succinate-semialdehyde dehydrogenase [Mangrovivirga cuniculi]QCK17007.1 succinate-semialdehyde dehydrogenase (NADP(+)) [Mangrovivirga cuniculi]